MGDFNTSDKIVLVVMLYLALITCFRTALIFFHPSLITDFSASRFANFAEFVIGAVIGYVGGKSEGKG